MTENSFLKNRCFGNKPGQNLYASYHDYEWGEPCHNDQKLFEMLILEGAQAGLNWETILKRRSAYRKAFYNFDPKIVASMTDEELNNLCKNTSIIRNKLKIYSARTNAKVFLSIQEDFGTFDRYLWAFVKGAPIINHWTNHDEVPTTTQQSHFLSKDLKKKGMTFVGPTIMYAYMQAVGLVNDHLTSCWRYDKNNL